MEQIILLLLIVFFWRHANGFKRMIQKKGGSRERISKYPIRSYLSGIKSIKKMLCGNPDAAIHNLMIIIITQHRAAGKRSGRKYTKNYISMSKNWTFSPVGHFLTPLKEPPKRKLPGTFSQTMTHFTDNWPLIKQQ